MLRTLLSGLLFLQILASTCVTVSAQVKSADNKGSEKPVNGRQYNYTIVPERVHGDNSNRVKIAYAAEGYTNDDIVSFKGHVSEAVNYLDSSLLSTRPYSRYFNFFNIYRIELISKESGVSQSSRFGQPKTVEVSNSLGGTKDEDRLGWVDRRLATQFFDYAAEGFGIDEFNWKFVILNNPEYHNSGGPFVVFSYKYGKEIALHEAGHGFHNLADEYYGKGVYKRDEPRQVNVTADSTGGKWKHWMDYVDQDTILGKIGVYEGAVYASKGAYRPSKNSKMGWTSDRRPASFNAVCREKIILDIYEIIRPVDETSDTTSLQINPDSLWVKVVDPEVLKIDWYINGELFQKNGGGTLLIDNTLESPGEYTIKAHVYDEVVEYAFSSNINPHPLDLVRKDFEKLQQDIIWRVKISK